jgi:putative hydrolase of HD superfamily
MKMPRSHQRLLGNTFDDVASHSYHVAVIAYVLCRMEKLKHEDGIKAVTMAVFHDLAEARTGDFGFIEKHYGKTDEEKAIKDQFEGLDFLGDLKNMLREFNAKETQIAKCVKDADSLAQIFQEWALAWQGNKMAKRWFDSDFNDRVPGLFTESAKKLATEMKDSDPQEWWWSEFMKDEKAVDLEKLLGRNKDSL